MLMSCFIQGTRAERPRPTALRAAALGWLRTTVWSHCLHWVPTAGPRTSYPPLNPKPLEDCWPGSVSKVLAIRCSTLGPFSSWMEITKLQSWDPRCKQRTNFQKLFYDLHTVTLLTQIIFWKLVLCQAWWHMPLIAALRNIYQAPEHPGLHG